MTAFTESIVEDAVLAWLETLGYWVLHGPDIAAGLLSAERSDLNYRDVVLVARFRQVLVRLNPDLPGEALEDVCRKLTLADALSLLECNRPLHRMLVDGIAVEVRQPSISSIERGDIFCRTRQLVQKLQRFRLTLGRQSLQGAT